MPDAILAAMQRYPGVTYSVRSGNGESIVRWVETGEADIGYALRRRTAAGVVEVRAFAQPLGVVTAPGHPLAASGGKVRLRDCFAHPLILMTPDTELRAMFGQIDARQPRDVRPLIETAGADGAAPRGRRCGCRLPDRRERRGRRGRRPARVDAACRCGARSFSCIYQRADMSATVAMTMFLEFFSRRSKRWRADSRAPAAQPASADGQQSNAIGRAGASHCDAVQHANPACVIGDVAHTTSGRATPIPYCGKILFMGLSNALPAHRGVAGSVMSIATTYENIGRQ